GAEDHPGLPFIPFTHTTTYYLVFFIPDSYLVPFENINVLLPAGQYTLRDKNGFSDSFTLVYNRVFGNPANPHNGDVYARIANFRSDAGDASLPEDESFDYRSGPVVKPYKNPLGIGQEISNF